MRIILFTLIILITLRFWLFFSVASLPALADEKEYLAAINLISQTSRFEPFALYSDASIPALNFYPAILIQNTLGKLFGLPQLISLRLVSFFVSMFILCLTAYILEKKFIPLIASFAILILGINPALLQFSIFGWFNIHTVFFTLLAYVALTKSLHTGKKTWFFLYVFCTIMIFQGYLIGKAIVFILSLIYVIELKKIHQRLLFIFLLALFIAPFVIVMFFNPKVAMHRIQHVTLIPQDVASKDFFTKQVFPTLAGFFGAPYTSLEGPDNPIYSPPNLALLPIYFAPLFLIGFLHYIQQIFLVLEKKIFPPEHVFWILIVIVVVGINMLTIYPLNISRSLLLVPVYTFCIAQGMHIFYNALLRKQKVASYVFFSAIMIASLFTIFVYKDWLAHEFYHYLYIHHYRIM